MTDIALIIACMSFVGLLLLAERREAQSLIWLAKPAASLTFVLLAVIGAGSSSFAIFIIIGLTLCLLGDVFLISKASAAFLAGMGAFALGHCAYIAAFLAVGAGATLPELIAGAAMMALTGLVLQRLWPYLGTFRWPVAGYCGVISIMVATAFAASPEGAVAPYWPLAAGAVGFAVSDIAVARDQFLKSDFINRLWGLPLYYAAQILIASSV